MFKILIIRNTKVKSLFNVVKVDFSAENVETIESMLTFEQAVELKETFSTEQETEVA